MRHRWTTLLAGAAILFASACDEDSDTIFGTYQVGVFENQDTCDGERNDHFGPVEVEDLGGGQVGIEFLGYPQLTGTFDSNDVLQAQGVVESEGAGTTTLRLQVIFFRNGLEGNGDLTFVGTHPDPEAPSPCIQAFTFEGDLEGSDNLVPTLMTEPDVR